MKTFHALFSLFLLPSLVAANETPRLVEAAGKAFVEPADGPRAALPIPGTATVGSFVAVGHGGWYAAAVDRAAAGRRLIVLKGAGSKAREIPAPLVQEPAALGSPVLLSDGGALRGLAWVEGEAPRRQVVRAAAHTAAGWGVPLTLSPRGAGSQLALTAAALPDGAQLLAWSAFDGTDDEILWTRLEPLGGTFSPPRRLAEDNAVPDVAPALWVSPEGVAWAAWSRYDGNDYRLMVARMEAEGWSAPLFAGPPGSLYPSLHAGGDDGPGDGPLVLHLQAAPRGWAVTDLDGTGQVERRALVETLRPERPRLESVTAFGVELGWTRRDGSTKARDEIVSAPWESPDHGRRTVKTPSSRR